jgi:hypothetical protein
VTGTSDAHDEITALLVAYAVRMDAGDFRGVGTLFARATLRNGSDPARVVARGEDEIAAMLERTIRMYDGRPGEQHVTSNSIVEVDVTRGVASARSVYVVFMAAPGFPLQPTGAGRYHDRFALDGDGWYFTDRLFLQDLHGDQSAHAATG